MVLLVNEINRQCLEDHYTVCVYFLDIEYRMDGSAIRQYIERVASREDTTSVAIAQRIEKGETFTTPHGASLSFQNDRGGKYIVAHDPFGNRIDRLDPSQISGGRRKKRRNTKKSRRTRRRSTRKN
jgi:hypothetical protein